MRLFFSTEAFWRNQVKCTKINIHSILQVFIHKQNYFDVMMVLDEHQPHGGSIGELKKPFMNTRDVSW